MLWRRQNGLESELRDHLERETEENIERGMLPSEARAAALRRFGSVALIAEDVRAVWIPVWVDQLLQDIRSGIRILKRERSFAAAAVLSIALGIAGSAVIFGLLDGLVFHPFPIPNPDRVVAVGATFPRLSSGEEFVETLSPPEFLDIAASKAIQHVAAFDLGNRNLSGGDRPERVFTGLALTDPFGPFGLRPAMGRGFAAEELLPNGPAVAILSDRIWRSRFGGDANIVGRAIRVNGRPTMVVGVMPPELLVLGVDLWIPWAADPAGVPRNVRQFTVIGRLADGFGLAAANAELSTIASRVANEHGSAFPEYADWRLRAAPWAEAVTRESRSAASMLLAAVALLMLIACANVSHLLLAHATTRRNEWAVRAGIGASTSRLARQLITEVVVLALLGGAIGVALATPALDAAMRLIPAQLNAIGLSASISARVLIWALSLTIGCAVLSAILPILSALRMGLHDALKADSRATTASRFSVRLRQGLIVAEIALAMTLMCGAALITRSSLNLGKVDPGFDTDNVLTMRVTLPIEKYQGRAIAGFFDQLAERVAGVRGVRGAAVASQFPPMATMTMQFMPEGTTPTGATLPTAASTVIGDAFFSTLGIPVVKGRTFDASDRADTPRVLVVNQTFVARYLPGIEPIGHPIAVGPPDRRFSARIVGVVRDTSNRGVRVAAAPEIFVPLRQVPSYNQLYLLVRTEQDPAAILGALRTQIATMDSDQPVYAIQTMTEAFADAEFRNRASMFVLIAFAIVGLVLGSVGVYGVIAYAVANRTKEFGVRMSLGADARAIRALVLGEGARMIGGGIAGGLLLVLLTARAMRGFLFGVTPTDPATLGAVSIVIAGLGMLACVVPVRRATSIDPMRELRGDG